jgi:Flp pilus assembly protein TadD
MRARDSICEQCHLSGEVRILNPGRQWSDFQPGRELEDVFSVYVREAATHPDNSSIKVVSHAEQLALSKCARSSAGNMWCGTCHDPHDAAPKTATGYRKRCLTCHGEPVLKTHAKLADNCVGCHMQQRQAKDGAHTVFTDHRISRKPYPTSTDTAPFGKLVAWHDPQGDQLALRNLGLANIEVGERERSAAMLEEGARMVVEAMKSLPPDPVMLSKVGLVLLRKGEIPDATEVFEYALQVDAGRAGSHVNLGNAYKEAGLTDRAIAEFNRAIELDPSLESAYRSLGETYNRANDRAGARTALQWYLKFMPQSVTTRRALSASASRE